MPEVRIANNRLHPENRRIDKSAIFVRKCAPVVIINAPAKRHYAAPKLSVTVSVHVAPAPLVPSAATLRLSIRPPVEPLKTPHSAQANSPSPLPHTERYTTSSAPST